MTKKETTLAMLRAAAGRGQGVTNRELNDAGVFRYSARIKELRDEGHLIDTIAHKKGLYEFRLVMFSPSGAGESVDPRGCGPTQQEGESAGGKADPPADRLPIFACDLNDSPYY